MARHNILGDTYQEGSLHHRCFANGCCVTRGETHSVVALEVGVVVSEKMHLLLPPVAAPERHPVRIKFRATSPPRPARPGRGQSPRRGPLTAGCGSLSWVSPRLAAGPVPPHHLPPLAALFLNSTSASEISREGRRLGCDSSRGIGAAGERRVALHLRIVDSPLSTLGSIADAILTFDVASCQATPGPAPGTGEGTHEPRTRMSGPVARQALSCGMRCHWGRRHLQLSSPGTTR